MRAAATALVLCLLLSGCFGKGGDDFDDGSKGGSGGASATSGEVPPPGVPHVRSTTWHSGDVWRYRIGVYVPGVNDPVLDTYVLTNEGETNHRGFDAYRVNSTRSDQDTFYTRSDLNPLDGGKEILYYDFPLWKGKTWTVAYRNMKGTAEVLGEESRSTGAGNFQAWRVKLTYDTGGYEVYWFSEQVKNEIRREVHSAQYRTVTDLASYTLEASA